MPTIPFHTGSYTIASSWAGAPHAHGAGIRSARLDSDSGEIVLGASTGEINPSFLARDDEAGLLWAITEPEFGGEILCCREDHLGGICVIGRSATGVDAPCHIAIDLRRRLGFVAHYHGGAAAAVSLAVHGRPRSIALLRSPAFMRGEDRSGLTSRPHASLPIGESELVVTDTGRDAVLLYNVAGDGDDAAFDLLDALPLQIGSGPRHMAHRVGGNIVYVSNQNSGGVSTVARVLTDAGPRLELRGGVRPATLGRDRPVPSEIALHPSGGFVYLANRGDNSLSLFSIELETGRLSAKGCVDVRGRNPRHFAMSPDGKYLIVANQDSDDLALFAISDGGGAVVWTGKTFACATPTSICF
jgi:6-phosphogluconolactonase